MVIYLDEFKFQRLLVAVPGALRDRALKENEANMAERGIIMTGHGNGFVVADISRARFPQVVSWLADYAACVDIQRNDVVPILGRGIDALVLVRGFDNYAEVSTKLSRLTPDEIVDACRHVSYELQAQANQTGEDDPLRGAFEAQAESDLVNAGLLREGEGTGNAINRPPAPDPQISDRFRDDPEPVNYLDPLADGRNFAW